MQSLRRTGVAIAVLLSVAGCASVRQLGSAQIGNSGYWVTGVQVKTKGLKGPDITVLHLAACMSQELKECEPLSKHEATGESILNAAVKGAVGNAAIGAGIWGGLYSLSRSKLEGEAIGTVNTLTEVDITLDVPEGTGGGGGGKK